MNRKDYLRASKEFVACNLCGGRNFSILAKLDRYLLPASTVICQGCGLIFINPRMTLERYNRFYSSGEYRRLLQDFKQRKANLEDDFNNSRKLGNWLGECFQSTIKVGLTVEVGSGTGGILAGISDKIRDIEVLGIEPSEEEAIFARKRNIRTIQASIESIGQATLAAETIISARSMNHLLDPRKFLTWSNRVLNPGGNLIVLVADFIKICEKRRMIFPQIDHPYMYTSETLQCLLTSTGFEMLFCSTKTIGSNTYILAVVRKNGESINEHPNIKNYQAQQIAMELANYKPPGVPYQIKNYIRMIKRKLKGRQLRDYQR